jgi:hypothetical protein
MGFRHEILMASDDGRIYRLGYVVTSARPAGAGGTRLLGCFPNPFNPSTTIRYRLEEPAEVRVEIVSVDGARVRALESGARGAGEHLVPWSGETDRGERAASGVYFARLIVGGVAVGATRMVLVQ